MRRKRENGGGMREKDKEKGEGRMPVKEQKE